MKMSNTLKILIVIALLAIFAVCAASADGCEKHDLHLIVFAQDADTEIGVKVGDADRKTEMVDAGVTYLTYKATEPEVSVLAYGDKLKPRVDKGRDGDWYSIVWVSSPGESVGE